MDKPAKKPAARARTSLNPPASGSGRDVSRPLSLFFAKISEMPDRASPASMSQLRLRAMSASATMPMSIPSYVTGRRRTCRSAMRRATSPASSCGAAVSRLRVMISLTRRSRCDAPGATQRRTMSRSVTMPLSLPRSSRTGTAPKLYCFISRAAAMTGSSSQIETTCPVMISLISIFPRSFVRSAISIVPKRGKYSPAD